MKFNSYQQEVRYQNYILILEHINGSRKNLDEYQELWINDGESVASSQFNSSNPTFFVIHGFLNNVDSEAIQLPKKSR